MVDDESLCIEVLKALQQMLEKESEFGDKGDRLRTTLIMIYFQADEMPFESKSSRKEISADVAGLFLSRANKTLYDMQCMMDVNGATDLVIDLIMADPSPNVFLECIQLAISLLEGGNGSVQKSFYRRFLNSKTEPFFRFLSEQMSDAREEIKANITMNTDSVTRKREEDKEDKAKDPMTRRDTINILKRDSKDTHVLGMLVSLSDDVKEQLTDAAQQTNKAYGAVRKGREGDIGDGSRGGGFQESFKSTSSSSLGNYLAPEITTMQPILRFLQLLCENHNADMQNYLRRQDHKTTYNLVAETLTFLDCICGSTTGGLGLLGLYINEHNVALINQTLCTLTEYCQGPCHENQNGIVAHECNGLDIIIALVLNEINPLSKHRMDLVMELKDNASKLVLGIMESRSDCENSEKILYNMAPHQLIDVCKQAYHQADIDTATDSEISPRDVGHNVYILAYQLSKHNAELAELLKQEEIDDDDADDSSTTVNDPALHYYSKHTAQIEVVRKDRALEQINFPVPFLCEYLTEVKKDEVYYTCERDEHNSKVSDFFERTEDLYKEMLWQKNLRDKPTLFWCSRNWQIWETIALYEAIVINLLVAAFYPFSNQIIELDSRLSIMIWLSILVSFIVCLTVPRLSGIRTLAGAIIIRLIFTLGIVPTLTILGVLNMVNRIVLTVSYIGNNGILAGTTFRRLIGDRHLLAHLSCLVICVLGLFSHEFFYSVLVIDVITREETLLNVVRSVTRNLRSILLTTLLALVLVYLFSIIGFLFFQDDFLIETEPLKQEAQTIVEGYCTADNCTNITSTLLDAGSVSSDDSGTLRENACDSLLMCIVTTMNKGLRSGGGIGDVLRSPSRKDRYFMARVFYDLCFFFIVIIIVLNLIFGVIIDTFADLRSEKQTKEEILKNSCFICGLKRADFDNRTVTFEHHIVNEHNMWDYLFFIVLIKVKDPTEFTGPESYVAEMIKAHNLDWFPRLRCMSLSVEDTDTEQNEIRNLNAQLESTNKIVNTLSKQLSDLREQMIEQRKHKQKLGLLHHPATRTHSNMNGSVYQSRNNPAAGSAAFQLPGNIH